MNRDKLNCKFCKFKRKEILYEDNRIWIVNTKDLKGHRRRIMVVTKEHTKTPSIKIQKYAKKKLSQIGNKIFNYVPAFCILSDRHSRFPHHWHRVASDFRGDDIEQIIDTPFEVVWIRRNWK